MVIEKISEDFMRSKIICVIISLSMLFCSFVGCAKREDDADVHVFYYTYSDTYISTVRASLDYHSTRQA